MSKVRSCERARAAALSWRSLRRLPARLRGQNARRRTASERVQDGVGAAPCDRLPEDGGGRRPAETSPEHVTPHESRRRSRVDHLLTPSTAAGAVDRAHEQLLRAVAVRRVVAFPAHRGSSYIGDRERLARRRHVPRQPRAHLDADRRLVAERRRASPPRSSRPRRTRTRTARPCPRRRGRATRGRRRQLARAPHLSSAACARRSRRWRRRLRQPLRPLLRQLGAATGVIGRSIAVRASASPPWTPPPRDEPRNPPGVSSADEPQPMHRNAAWKAG